MTVVAERIELMVARKSPRITLDVSEEAHQYLSEARFTDGVTIADRLRALISLLEEDPGLAERTRQRARQIAKERSSS